MSIININLFPVSVKGPLNLYEDERKKYPSLKELRERYSCQFYAYEDKVYAYGNGASELIKYGFKAVYKDPVEVPKITCRIILEGFRDRLRSLGYNTQYRRFIMQAFDTKNPISLSIKEFQVLKGCEARTVYLRNALTSELVFGIIVNLRFKLEFNGNPCSYAEIRKIISLKYNYLKASDIIREIRIKTGDLTPEGKINTQASRFRYENILMIMRQIGEKIKLPDGSEAYISLQPTPIIIEV